jgi:hypothetical protein
MGSQFVGAGHSQVVRVKARKAILPPPRSVHVQVVTEKGVCEGTGLDEHPMVVPLNAPDRR